MNDVFNGEYYRILALYQSMSNYKNTDSVDNLTNILCLGNENRSVAAYTARSQFHMRHDQRSVIYTVGNPYSPFTDQAETRAKDLFIKIINDYLRQLETYRYGNNKLLAFYTYIIYNGLMDIIPNLYIPEKLRPIVTEVLDEQVKILEQLIQKSIDYFTKYNNEKLNIAVKSLDRFILEQRTDQVIEALKTFEPKIGDADFEFIGSLRVEFLEFNGTPQLKYIEEKLGISDKTYRGALDLFISELCGRMDKDSYKLLTELFLRNG